ncbi:MAG: ThuA domain-containing protein [Planctomycetaceae bacterium]|jgi:hypothetical protein|nr:ThuA domain-containing protein [Planctomycetaceae bacterium]
MKHSILLFVLFSFLCVLSASAQTLYYKGTPDKPGSGKNVVLVSGDEEYRSEEMVVQLGRILAEHHGFNCTVLFAINPQTGEIDPLTLNNIPGLEALLKADIAVFFLRFRDLPDEQMKYIDDYLKAGKPVIGIRTATHAFSIKSGTYRHYSFDYSGEKKDWQQGFGRKILGETWINHHGHHGKEATRGIVAPEQKSHPIVKGCEDIFGPTDVYQVRLPLPDSATPLFFGQVLSGMNSTDKPVENEKNDPMMPLAWLKPYSFSPGTNSTGVSLTSTIGSSQDFAGEGVRRMFVNAVYYLTGLESVILDRAEVGIVGKYEPLPMGFGKCKKGLKPADLADTER